MKFGIVAFFLFWNSAYCNFSQPAEMRELCKEAQGLEFSVNKIVSSLSDINRKEKMSLPAIVNIYEILSRYCTVLASIQRFSDLLILSKYQNKSDFIRCSILIKSFTNYFQSVSSKLGKENTEIVKLQKEKNKLLDEKEKLSEKYNEVCEKIDSESKKLLNTKEENVIQNDVVFHIATKSESIEELDAELEAENIVGVLKNTKISTSLKLAYPAKGKIVTEFGDRGNDDEMICYLGFETRRGAIVTSPAEGLVVFSGNFLNYNNMVIISNGDYRIFLYGMKNIFVSTGDIVKIGDYVGKMDDNSKEAPIVKLELRKSGEPLDPRHWILQSLEKGTSK